MNKITILIAFLLSLFSINSTNANFFPLNAESIHFDISQNYTDYVLISSGSNIIYNISFLKDSNSAVSVSMFCGSGTLIEIFDTSNAPYYSVDMQYRCNDNIYLTTTGYSGTGKMAHIILTFVTEKPMYNNFFEDLKVFLFESQDFINIVIYLITFGFLIFLLYGTFKYGYLVGFYIFNKNKVGKK